MHLKLIFMTIKGGKKEKNLDYHLVVLYLEKLPKPYFRPDVQML